MAKKRRVDVAREERFPERIPVSLRVQTKKGEVEQSGTTVDISVLGLQVETSGVLAPGQKVSVPRFGNCTVVWVRSRRKGKPLRAGLKAVK
jgi:hypothetical protein